MDQGSEEGKLAACTAGRPSTPELEGPQGHRGGHNSKRGQEFGALGSSGGTGEPAGTGPGPGLFQELWTTKAWRVYPMMLFYVVGMTALGPLTPTLMTNFFASRAAGETLNCEKLQPQPPACQDAHSEAVNYSSVTAFVSNSILSFLLMPLVGDMSDVYGRKPFMAAAILLAAVPVGVLLMYINLGTSLLWYYPASALQGAASSVSISLALLADVLSPSARGPAFGGLMAAFSLGIMIGPTIGGIIMYKVEDGFNVTAWLAFATCLLCALYVLVALPDTILPSTRARAKRRLEEDTHLLQSVGRAARILGRSSLFKKLTVCLMLSGAVGEGMIELLVQYLQLVANFQPGDQMTLYVLYGFCALLVQAALLPWLLGMYREKRTLTIGLVSSLLQQALLIVVRAKWAGFVAMAFGSLSSVAFPAISAIKSNNSSQHEQGAVQGALYGARALAMGFGPLLFAGVFRLFTKSDSPLPYFPGAPFVVGVAGMAAAVACALSIERDEATAAAAGPGSGASLGDQLDDASNGGTRHAPAAAAADACDDEETRLLQPR